MEGIQHFRRRKCKVLNLNPMKTKDGDDYTIRFCVNGMSVKIEQGDEVDLLEPAYNALVSNERVDHELQTSVDPHTGDVTYTDKKRSIKQYSVSELGEWYWPEGHSPYDSEGNNLRPDLTKEELAKAPRNPQQVKKKEAVV